MFLKIRFSTWVILLLTLIVGAGCSKDKDGEEPTPPAPSAEKFLEVDAKNIKNISPEQDVFIVDPTVVKDVEVDKILIITDSEKTPGGLLRRVDKVNAQGDNLEVHTVQAYLEEILENEDIKFNSEFTIADLERCESLSENGTFECLGETQKNGETKSVTFSNQLSDELSISGSLDSRLSINLDVDANILKFKLTKLELDADASINASLTGKASSTYNTELEADIGKLVFKSRTVRIYGFPIIIYPIATVSIGAKGLIEGGVSIMPSYTATAKENIIWKEFVGFSHNPSFESNPDLAVNATAKAGVELYVKVKVDFFIYGVVGPYVTPEVAYNVNVDNENVCSPWDAKAELRLGSGISVSQVFTKSNSFSYDFPTLPITTIQLTNDGSEICNDINSPPPNSAGDVHLLTPDGLAYDFQGAGEYQFLESSDGNIIIQARQEPFKNSTTVSINTAVAMNVAGDRVGVYLNRSPALYINGVPTTIENQVIQLPSGGIMYFPEGNASTEYRIRWPSGFIANIYLKSSYINIGVSKPEGYTETLKGVIGNLDSNPDNDVMTRTENTILEEPVAYEDLYNIFGNSWRITQAESLFDYEAGTDTETFTDLNFPSRPLTVDDLDNADYDNARQQCAAVGINDSILLNNCTLDLAVTSDNEFIESSIQSSSPKKSLEIVYPVYFDNWTSESNVSNAGNWQINDDGRKVIQTLNGSPTFFVSPQEYMDYKIEGKLFVNTSSDDDFIGFAIGYKDPLEASAEPSDFYDMILFDWKQTTQTTSGLTAMEGFTLSRLNGVINPENQLWDHLSDNIEVLDTDYGKGKGWRDRTEYTFTLYFKSNSIRILIDNVLIFDGEGSFQNGFFGFYNYSQANVQYYDFTAVKIDD